MSMKKRILSALLALCLTGSLAGTALAAGWQATPETARAAARQVEDTPAAPAAQPATAETAAPATPETAALPARTVEVTDAASGITVTVDVPEGALPVDAELQVTLLGGGAATPETAQTPDDVAGELDGAGIEYDDFVSMDLTFYDAAGQEVEPLKPVQVRFTLPAALLPDDVDPATLAVQHLAEDENGEVETVETLADAADTAAGTVTLDGDVTAAFETDGFSVYALTFSAKPAPRADGDGSTFTVTFNWDYYTLPDVGLGDLTDAFDRTIQVVFKIVDTEGNALDLNLPDYKLECTYQSHALTPSTVNKSIYEGTIEDFLNGDAKGEDYDSSVKPGSSFFPGIEETDKGGNKYKLERVVYADDLGRHPVDRILIGSRAGGGTMGFTGIRLYDSVLGQFDGENTTLPGSELNYYNNGYYNIEEGSKDYTVELVYQKQPEPAVNDDYDEPVISKQAVLKDDGTYDLSLRVVGEEIVPPASTKLDVLFVLDGSSSMKNDAFSNGTTYQAALESAATALVDKLEGLEWNDPQTGEPIELDIRYAAVQYGYAGSGVEPQDLFDDAWEIQRWTSDAGEIKTAINASDQNENDGGTNTQAGLLMAASTLQEVRPDARSYVIFISDGEPSAYYTSVGSTAGTLSGDTAQHAPGQANFAAAKFPWVNGFYAIYINDGNNSDPLDNMKAMLATINGDRPASGGKETRVGGPYFVTNSDKLTETFDKLVEEMSIQRFTDVEVSDILSNWVEPVADASGNITPKLTIYQAQRDQETGELVCDEKTGEWLLTEIEEKKADPDDVYKEVSVDYDTTERKITLKTEETRQDTTGTTGSYYDPAHLRGDYVYEVTLNVKLTEDRDNRKTAEGFFTVEGRYPEMDNPYAEKDGFADGPETKGDSGTGTHAGQAGFYSNKEATLNYSVFSDPQDTMNFKKPVVQMPYVKLTITKTVEGPMGSYGDDFDFKLTLSKQPPATGGGEPGGGGGEGDGDITTTPDWGDTGFSYIGAAHTARADETVYWIEPLKIISGPAGAGTGGLLHVTENTHEYAFTLSHDEQIVLDVPVGYTAVVTEEDVKSRGYEAAYRAYPASESGQVDGKSADVDRQTAGQAEPLYDPAGDSYGAYFKNGNTATLQETQLTEDYIVDFQNTRQAVAPTGLEGDHTAPYVLMVSASALAGMALLGGVAARRARRRREW